LHSQVFLSMCIISMLFMLFVSLPCFGKGAKGDKELLKLVAVGHEANLSSLRTWRAQVETVFKDGESVTVRRESDFQFDRSAGAIRFDTTWYEKEKIFQDKDIVTYDMWATMRIPLFRKGEMLVPQDLPRGHNVVHVTNKHVESADIDPMRYFRNGEEDLEDTLNFYYESWDMVDWTPYAQEPLSVKRDGNIVTLRVEMSHDFNQYEFDLSKGCNLVRYSSGTGKESYERTIEWEEINRVFVPAHIQVVVYHYDGDEETLYKSREMTFSNNKVNEPIDSKVFTPEDLVLSQGDVIFDYRNNIKKVYTGNGSWENAGPVNRRRAK